MHHKTLFKSFNNKNTTTEKDKKRQRTNTKKKKKIGNNILVGYSLLDTKMENYQEQYTNKKRRQRIKSVMVRTSIHGGYTGHRPLRNITIEH